MLDALKCLIRISLQRACPEKAHLEAVMKALARPGFPLDQSPSCKAGLLTIESYRTISGNVDSVALHAGAGVELQMAASFIFDNVADDELDPENDLTASEELAIAITLMSCGASKAFEASSMISQGDCAAFPMRSFFTNQIAACGGLYMDAYLQKRSFVDSDEALNMTLLKSGNVGRFAAAFGASLATKDSQIVSLIGNFGFNLFSYLQLIDDLRDARPVNGISMDMIQSKKTLPLVFFNEFSQKRRELLTSSKIASITMELTDDELLKEYEASGAGLFCAIVAEVFLNRAKTNLQEVEKLLGKVEGFERLVSSVEVSAKEIFTDSEGDYTSG